MNPLLEIIIPVKNYPAVVDRVLADVVRQMKDERRAHLIVVDDSSDDSTPQAVGQFIRDNIGFDRAILMRNRNDAGIGGARNCGVDNSESEYVAFFDADDAVLPGALTKICDVLASQKPELAIWGFERIGKEEVRSKWIPEFSNPAEIAFAPTAAWLKAIRRDRFVRFPEGVFCEDSLWHFRQVDLVDFARIATITEPLYVFDRDSGTITPTMKYLWTNPMTLEALAFSDELALHKLNPRAVSDCLRNLASLFDMRCELKKDTVRQAWASRLHSCYLNVLSGRWNF